jgi:hypothetical protein
MRRCRIALCFGVGLLWAARSAAQDAPPSYTKEIRPLLDKYCIECHRIGNLKGGANLESLEGMMKGGRKGKTLLVAGKPDDSPIVTTTEGKTRPFMPPKKSKKKPTDGEVAKLRAWVAAGAKDDTPKTGGVFVPEGRLTISQNLSPGLPYLASTTSPVGTAEHGGPPGSAVPSGLHTRLILRKPRTEVLGYCQSSLRD